MELISGGAQIAVTNENKMHYLNLLAQYRLASQVRDEVEHFLKGKHRGRSCGPEPCLSSFVSHNGVFHQRARVNVHLNGGSLPD